jgi:ATP-dependent Lon protease
MEKIDFNEAELIVSKATLPTITLRGIVAFPSTVESFELIRETSKNATKKALETNSQVFLVTQKNASEEDPKQEDLYQIGVVAKIEQKVKIDDDTERIIISGSYRAKMTELKEAEGYLEATVEEIQESSLEDSVKNEALIEGVVSIFYKYASTINKKVDEIKKNNKCI